MSDITDVLVVGGGPAGMTAALYALRNGKSVLIIEKEGFGGQITHSPKVENYPGTLSMSGTEFADRLFDQIIAQGAEFEIETVTGIRKENGLLKVTSEEGTEHTARSVIIAAGVKHRTLDLEGEDELIGEGISFCAVCDGDFYAGRKVCVAGGGNSALQEAVLLSGKCSEVIILQDLPYLTGEKKLQEILAGRDNVRVITNVRFTKLLKDGDTFRGVEIEDRVSGGKQEILCDGMFEAVGMLPQNEAFADLADLDERGYFDSDESCLTRTPGVFAAGDCRRKSIRQVTTAAADGAVAALAACWYIDRNF